MRRLPLVAWLVGLSLAQGTDRPVHAQTVPEHPDEAASTTATIESAEASGFPALPRVMPAPRDAAKVRVDQLTKSARDARDGLASAEYLLASANAVLAFELEPFCTQRFLQIPTNEPVATEQRTIETLLTRAVALVDDAIGAMDASEVSAHGTQPEEDAQPNRSAEANPVQPEGHARRVLLRRHARALRTFAAALAAYLLTDKGDGAGADRVRAAASRLAPMLEDENRRVATAALFWQSLLRSGESNPDPVLSRLDYVSAPLPPDTNPFSFLGRLLRCRSLAEHRPAPVALALLLQLDERCYDWFEQEPERHEALRTVALVRLQVLRAWYDSWEPDTSRDERGWCAEQARRIVRQFFEGASTTILRLRPAIPILVPAPGPDAAHDPS